MMDFGVCAVFFGNTSAITIASASVRYRMRQVTCASTIRNSWHRAPMRGIGRDWGNANCSPRWSLRRRYPASILASLEKGGVLTCPWSQTSGLSCGLMESEYMSERTYSQELILQHNHRFEATTHLRFAVLQAGRYAAS